ncbi:MAG: acyl-CoA thioesterase [Gammaproteobacteria bacterium]|nr:acyl-CoA thioesterase [Gammaproteobacteria bacterium]
MSELSCEHRSHYRYWVPIATRWMDNDVYGHVNNVTYYSYFDTAANDFLIKVGGLDIHSGDVIAYVVASRCEYKKAVSFPDQLNIGVRVNRLGTSSVEYGLAVFRHDEAEAAAFGSFTHVFVSREHERPVPVPEQIRNALEGLADHAG